MVSSPPSVILVAHGSGISRDAEAAALEHARSLRDSGRYGQVEVCFLSRAEETAPPVPPGDVFLVPLFMSSGYFVATRIPALFGLEGRLRVGEEGRLFLCDALGEDPALADILSMVGREAAAEMGAGAAAAHLLFVAHGSGKSPASRLAAERHRLALEARREFAAVSLAFLSEPPYLADWLRAEGDAAGPLVVVGLFSADGPHAAVDVPEILHIWQRETGGLRRVHYTGAIGPRPEIAGLIERSIARTRERFA